MGKITFGQYLREQRSKLPVAKPVDDVSSQTIMVTGSNVGLGFEASVHLANLRPKTLVVTCRDQAKCEQTRESIVKRAAASGVSDAPVLAQPLELGSFEKVRAFVDKYSANGNNSLNVLVANAGVVFNKYSQTQDGWEVALQVNYLSTALLSILLLPHLINSAAPDSPSRLVIVSSFSVYFHCLKDVSSWKNILQTFNAREYPDRPRYALSKLLGIIFVRELASRLPESTPVIATAANPGFCKSNIFRTPLVRFTYFILGKLLSVRTTEEGSRTLLHAAVASDRSMHGHYLSSCQVTEEPDFLLTPEGKAFSTKVWDETIEILSGIDSRVPEIVEKYLSADSADA